MLRIVIDENLDQRILRGLRRRLSALDYVVTQEEGMKGAADPVILAWAAEQQRVLVTHDVNTIPTHAYERVSANLPMPGVVIVPEDMGIGVAIEELAVVIECADPDDLDSQVLYLPL
jgi:hypothetical protein